MSEQVSVAVVQSFLTDAFLKIREASGGRGSGHEYFAAKKTGKIRADNARELAAINELADICHNLPRYLTGDQGVAFMIPSCIERANQLYETMGWKLPTH